MKENLNLSDKKMGNDDCCIRCYCGGYGSHWSMRASCTGCSNVHACDS